MDQSGGGVGGVTLSQVYQSARRLVQRAGDGLAQFERVIAASATASGKSASFSYSSSGASVGADSSELCFAVKRDIAQIESLCIEMDHLWRSIPTKPQQDLWKRKVELIAEEVSSLKNSLDKQLLRQQKRMMEAKERAELFERANSESSHILQIFDDEARAMQSAHNSSVVLEEAYATGVAILSKYADQRDRLKRAQRKALDILNTVGLSNSVLKLIEKRHRVDKWIAYAGMIVTIVVVFAFWRWTH